VHPEKIRPLEAPFNQKVRIAALRIAFAAMLPLLILTQSRWTATPGVAMLLETLGIIGIFTAVLGRFWAILYIGGRKNTTVMQEGPYSICRHPLYLFSTVGAAGFGLMLGSLVLAGILGGVTFFILSLTAAREEVFLRRALGAEYEVYASGVPRMLPALNKFHTPELVTFDTATLTRNAADALVFVALIPLAEILQWVRALELLPSLLLV
jgi:protein-S-isoprenylcysteine O-methyltransferase Ste14